MILRQKTDNKQSNQDFASQDNNQDSYLNTYDNKD